MQDKMRDLWVTWMRRLQNRDKKTLLITGGAFGMTIALAVFIMLIFGSDQASEESIVPAFRDEYREFVAEFDGQAPEKGAIATQGLDGVVRDYLVQHVGFSSFGDKVFCSFEELGLEKVGEGLTIVLWVYCAEVYEAHQTLRQGGGVSTPVILIEQNGAIADHHVPSAGNEYDASVRGLFPEKYHQVVFPSKFGLEQHNERVRWLSYLVYEQAADFYQFGG